MKGITPVVAIILLLLITISITGFAFMFFGRVAQTSAERGEQQLGQQIAQVSGQFSIEGTSPSGQIYVRNRGSGLLANFSVFVDDAAVQWSAAGVAPGSVGPINITTQLSAGAHRVKVCTASLCDSYALNYVRDPLSDGLILYLPLSEGSGTTAGDASGSGNNGMISGATWTSGKSGNGLSFDGINDWVDISSVRMSENSGTIALWAKEINSANGAMLIGYHLGLRTYIQTSESSGMFYVTKGNPETTINFPSPNRDGWHHLVLSWEGGTMKGYKDGVLIDTKAFTNGATTHDAAIGQLNNANFFNGVIDEVRMYDRSLSAEEITALYERDRGDTLIEGLVLYLPMNEGSGTTASDISGTGNNGLLVNGTSWAAGRQGNAVQFDGVNDAVAVAHSASLDFEITDKFSVAAWAKVNDISSSGFPLYEKGGAYKGIYIHLRSSVTIDAVITERVSQRAFWRGPAGVDMTAWNHYAFTYDGSQSVNGIKVYVNGAGIFPSYTENTLSGSIKNTRDALVGASDSPYYANGAIDEVRVYNRVLSQEEVNALYTTGS
ncbi:MAG: LamG domain-containing protein [Candidatus Aenigmarchaeota archaeon]|nr:LamG domain-containing protein [Candidatus Aenigmarchaeota archaeon]